MGTQAVHRSVMYSPGVQTVACLGKQIVNFCDRRSIRAIGWLVFVACYSTCADAQTEIAKTRPATAISTSASEALPQAAAPEASTGARAETPIIAGAADVAATQTTTTFTLRLSSQVAAHAFVLPNPYRVVIDLPEVHFQLPDNAGHVRQGLVTGFRYGLFSAGRSRVVIDTAGPVAIVQSGVKGPAPDGHFALQVSLVGTTAAAFADAAATTAAAGISPSPPIVGKEKAIESQAGSGKPVIMIDPGHGGIDAGAVSVNGALEKDVVLGVAQRLKALLESQGRYDVRMTRSADRFVSLDQRVAMSRAAGASLFISIHADSVEEAALAQVARGATVYTISEHASNAAAQAVADKENAADAAGGMSQEEAATTEQVNSILADLLQRETSNFSMEFRNLLLQRLRPAKVLAHDPARSAGFKVLRQAQTPTVLIELGFLSNPDDAARLQQVEWQKTFIAAIASAIDSYTARRHSPAP